MSERRLIGIDAAWGKRKTTGCAELIWDGVDLTLKCFKLLRSVEDIVKWIEPDRGDWVVAVDAPLVICNKEGQRPAENQASTHYGKYDAGAHSTNLKRKHSGPQLLGALVEQGGQLVERVAATGGRRIVFETYPHIAMVELFRLRKSIKYKSRWVDEHYPTEHYSTEERFARQLEGQQELIGHISEHLCSSDACPRLLPGGKLDDLFRKPASSRTRADLNRCEDLLDGLVCAYTAAWLDIGGDLVGLGPVGEGVIIAPRVQGIGPLLP